MQKIYTWADRIRARIEVTPLYVGIPAALAVGLGLNLVLLGVLIVGSAAF